MSIDNRQIEDLLPSRRWFGSKGRAVAGVEVVDEAILKEGPPALVETLVRVSYEDGGPDLYQMPLIVETDGTIADALDDVELLRALGPLMAQGATIKGRVGTFRFNGPGLDPLAPPGGASVRSIGAEQTNSSVVIDETIIVKLFRRIEPGPNPDLELGRLLTGEGFAGIPAQVGELSYEGVLDGESLEFDLGISQQYLTGGRDGWLEALAQLGGLCGRAEEDGHTEVSEDIIAQHAGDMLDALGELGDVTASLHVLLSKEDIESDLASEPVDGADVKEWVQRTHGALDRMLDSNEQSGVDLKATIEETTDRLMAIQDPGRKARIHGDYHLGQVMLTKRGWMILDFEGEPARSLEERRQKDSPLRDVAGMLRSFDYAATAALFQRTQPGTETWDLLEPWAHAWEENARSRFLSAYLRTSHPGGFLPSDRDTLAVMLDVFEIDKALYELFYERNHRPAWARIPLRGIRRALERSAGR